MAKILGLEILPSWADILQTGGQALKRLFGQSHATPAAEGKDGISGDPLKANVFGIGKKDESMFLDAVALAYERGLITIPEVNKLTTLYESLTPTERDNLGEIVGISEEDVKSKTTALERNPDGTPTTDSKGNPIHSTKEESFRGNVRGMRLMVMLAKMDPLEAEKHLRATGALNGVVKNIEERWKEIDTFLKSPQAAALRKKIKRWYKKLDPKVRQLLTEAKDRSEQAALWYIGATDIAGAEANVLAREAEVARRRAQTWHERSLQHHPKLLGAWAVMGIIIVGSIVLLAIKA